MRKEVQLPPPPSALPNQPRSPFPHCLGLSGVPITNRDPCPRGEAVNPDTVAQLHWFHTGASRCARERLNQTPHASSDVFRISSDLWTACWRESCNFTTHYVSRLDDSVTGGLGGVEVAYSRNKEQPRLSLERFAQGDTVKLLLGLIDRAAGLHGLLKQQLFMMLPITRWALVSCRSLHFLASKLQSVDRFESDRMGSQTCTALQKQALLWFVIGESHTPWFNGCSSD